MDILLVEDNPADRYLLREEFAAINGEHCLREAGTVAAALEAIAEARPDVVLLDLSLPDGLGLETLRAFQGVAPDLPVIVLSGNADQKMAIEAVRNGAQDYVLKGRMDPDGLLRTLKYAIERARVKARLRASEARFRRLFDAVPVGVFQMVVGGRLLAANTTMVRQLGFECEADIIRASAAGSLYADNGQLQEVERLLKESGVLDGFEAVLFHRSGREMTMLVSAVAVVDAVKGDITIEGTLIDISARKESERLLKEQAEVDELTGIMNRRAFRAISMTTLANAAAQCPQLKPAILIFDLDGFKEVNDTLGHKAGDELLRAIASRVSKVLRSGDSFARHGGDEFTILCNVAEPRHVTRVADKVCSEVARPFIIDGRSVRVGSSMGIALHTEHGDDFDTLLAAADAAMYRAKRGGKGRYEFADAGPQSGVA